MSDLEKDTFARPASAPFAGIPEKSHLKFAFSGQIRYPEGRDSLSAAASVACLSRHRRYSAPVSGRNSTERGRTLPYVISDYLPMGEGFQPIGFLMKRYAMCDYTEESCANKEKLVLDLRKVIDDADEILRETAGVAGEKIAVLREHITEHLNDAKARLDIVEDQLVDKTKAVAQAADDFVNESPWQAVGIAAGVGVLLGILVARR
jgi:ElaB/YqjD/DUF883 family membrane-anchored ribosome-binding protein